MTEPCRVEKTAIQCAGKHFVTLPQRILKREDVMLVATGTLSCVRTVYIRAWELGKLHQFVPCVLSRREYAAGLGQERLAAVLREAAGRPGVAGIVVYLSCADMLIQWDLEQLLEEAGIASDISVQVLRRGPLAARTGDVETRLKKILSEIPLSDGVIRQISFPLPPPAPDNCGIISLLQEWDVYPFLLTAGGCDGCLSMSDGISADLQLDHSRFNDLELALGIEANATAGIAGASAASGKGLACVIGSAVPDLIGTDMDSVLEGLQEEGVSAMFCPASGFEAAPKGIADTLLVLGQALLRPCPRQTERVNILGYSDLGFGSPILLEQGVRELAAQGYTATVWGTGSLVDAGEGAGAALNWVVAAEGLPLARHMQQWFGVPFVAGIPFGATGTRHWRGEVARRLGESWDVEEECRAPKREKQPGVLLVGQPMVLDAVRTFLRDDMGLIDISCALYAPTAGQLRLYDAFAEGRAMRLFDTAAALAEQMPPPDIVLADPLLCGALKVVWPDACFCHFADPMCSGRHYLPLEWQRPDGAFWRRLESNIEKIDGR